LIKVKICGVRTPEDARKCVDAGADALGMLLAPSPRRITVSQAREIAEALPPTVRPVVVIMPSTADEAITAARAIRPGAIQLQGDEPPEMVAEIKKALPGTCVVKAVHVGEGREMEKALAYEKVADAILLDTMSPNRGGSGTTHDWAVSKKIVASVRKPVILAGGLNPENVADAIRAVRPYAVDVASGVEGEGRVKDVALVEAFIVNAKEASNGHQ
jgi:phosphoribosylanthranilate isomerase